MDEDHVANFVAITGASTDVANGFLQITSGNFERAIELFFENPDLVSGVGAGAAAAASAANPPTRPQRSNIGHEDADGVIHIPSDDEDMDYADSDGEDASGGRAVAAAVAATAQEEEDAAMAKRLQEELYSEGGAGPGAGGADDVRAPIGRTTETLIAPGPGWAGEDDGAAAFLEQMRRRRPVPRKFYSFRMSSGPLLT